MNFGQLVTAVRNRLGSATDDGVLTEAVIKDFVKEALAAIEVERDWHWLDTVATFTTTAGTDTYAPPASWARTQHLRVSTQNEHLSPISIEEADWYLGSTGSEARGMPSAWTYHGGNLVLRPVPDAVYTVQHRYLRTETDLSVDSDSPLMPSRFHWAVVEYATFLGFRLVGDEGRAASARGEFDGWLRRMANDGRAVARAPRIRDRSEV